VAPGSNGNAAPPLAAAAPPIILPAKLHLSITYEFAQSRLDCQVSPANCVSYSQLISILSQLITTFAGANMTAESEYFKQEAARVSNGKR
jgi:hypothetical protein